MGLIRFQRLGISVTAAALAVGAALAFAPPASASTDFDHYGCTKYGLFHTFCVSVSGYDRHVFDIEAFGRGSTWNGYIVATITAPKGNTVYRKQSRYEAKSDDVYLDVSKTFPKNGKYKACAAGYSIQHGKYHQFAKACQNIF
jgi:hypothetical protein